MKILWDKKENAEPMLLYNSNEMLEVIAYALYYSVNPDSTMCIPNCAYEKAEKMFKKWLKENEDTIDKRIHKIKRHEDFISSLGEAYLKKSNTHIKWTYIKDKLPPEPEDDGTTIKPLTYICAYKVGEDDFETDVFEYYGKGVFNGENERYPIYAWLSPSVIVPKPPKEK